MRKDHLAGLAAATALISLCLGGACATQSQLKRRSLASDAPQGQDFENTLSEFGLKSWYGNLHAHHFMKHQAPNRPDKKKGPAEESDDDEEISASCNIKGNFPEDDGRACRLDRSGHELHLSPERVREFTSNARLFSEEALASDSTLLYFKMACDYAFSEGGLDVLFITPHSKNGEVEQDTSTLENGFASRQRALDLINESYEGRFYCGLGQEVSSISKGNHVNVFGHFGRTAGEVRPFFFPTGAFDTFYRDVKDRKQRGEGIFLQFNHPETRQDLWWGAFQAASKKKKKTLLNDYGLDDFPPVGCIVSGSKKFPSCPEGSLELSAPLLAKTFENIRGASGDAYSLIEVIPPLGATSNPGVDFKKVHRRMDQGKVVKEEVMKPHDGLYDFIFYLAMGFKLAPTANQDNHFANWGSATASRTGILAPSLAERDIFEALKNRRTFVTEDQNAKMAFYVTDASSESKALMGDELTTQAESVSLVVSYADSNSFDKDARLRFFYYRANDEIDFSHRGNPLGVFRVLTFGEDGTVQLPTEANPAFSQMPGAKDSLPISPAQRVRVNLPLVPGMQYVFAEITQTSDADKVISAPVWVRRR